MNAFEAIMLICFGLSWPISIAKTLRARRVEGKTPLFMIAITIGYASGIVHKVLHAFDWVTAIYALNLTMVLIDLALYYRFRRAPVASP